MKNSLVTIAWMTLLLCAGLDAMGQGAITYQRFYTENPNPDFPWDYEGHRMIDFPPQTFGVDLNRDGNDDFMFEKGQANGGGFRIYGLSADNRVLSAETFDSDLAYPLDPGDRISGSLDPFQVWAGPNYIGEVPTGSVITSCVNIGCIGLFTGVESAYIGLQMEVDGQTHYGWVRAGAPIPGINGGYVYDAAFNTIPGEFIFAAQVPEPSVWALLGIGGVFVVVSVRAAQKSRVA